MTCSEFQHTLPDYLEGGRSAEQQAHLRSCFECSTLLADLDFISRQAQSLQSCADPSPRVWNSIEIALRQEGVVRPTAGVLTPLRGSGRWNFGWLVPVAAAIILAGGVVLYQRTPRTPEVAEQPQVTAPVQSAEPFVAANASVDDDQFYQMVAARSPAVRDAYMADLKNVNEYIRDAEQSVRSDPYDDEAQQSLVDAYEQRAMVYELAVDRSVP
jgi:hypothetical protein